MIPFTSSKPLDTGSNVLKNLKSSFYCVIFAQSFKLAATHYQGIWGIANSLIQLFCQPKRSLTSPIVGWENSEFDLEAWWESICSIYGGIHRSWVS